MSLSSEDPLDHDTAALERTILSALCHHFDALAFRRKAIARLRQYRFTVREHQCIFDALCSIPHRPGAALRQHLLQRLTTMGFPDVDLAFLQQGPQPSMDHFRDALQLLLPSSLRLT